jgi:hypothetical protein
LAAPEEQANDFVVEVARLSVGISVASKDLLLSPGETTLPFVRRGATRDQDVDLALRVRAGVLAELEEGSLVFDSGGSWKLSSLRDGGRCFRFFDSRLGPIPYKAALLSEDGRKGEIVLDPAFHSLLEPIDPIEFPLDELLFLTLLARMGGIEFHACGVKAPDGRGFIFAGHSGDGKTTMARLWEAVPGAIVLSDDRIVLREGEDGGWWMYGTPWHGEAELAANVGVKVAAIFVLDRGDTNAFRSLQGSDAMTALLARSFPPFHASEAMEDLLVLLERLVQTTDVDEFRVLPGKACVALVLAESA